MTEYVKTEGIVMASSLFCCKIHIYL